MTVEVASMTFVLKYLRLKIERYFIEFLNFSQDSLYY